MDGEVSRPGWDTIWMDFANSVSRRSVDPKYKVGAVIVSEDNTRVFSIGYNGDHAGGPNRRDSMSVGSSGFIHAEINALIKCNYDAVQDKKLYVTYSPCPVCAKACINAGIKEIIYDKEYTADTRGIELLKSAGVLVRKLELADDI